MLKHYNEKDIALWEKLEHRTLLAEGFDPQAVQKCEKVKSYTVRYPTPDWQFLHEAAIVEFHGKLYASWYHNADVELMGRTPIMGATSADGGKTWEDIRVIADDPTGEILYCPPVYGVQDDKLYLFLNQMVSADHMHALELYALNEERGDFECVWSQPLPFKLNTNVYALPNGKLLLPGRIAEPDGFPNTPAVLLSDSGRMEGPWRLVKIAPNGDLPDGSKLIHPELSAVIDGDTVTIFCRDDERNVPLLYVSHDGGETWSQPIAHDIPFSNSKIYSGTLSDGRNYVIGNLYPQRSRLAIFFAPPHSLTFDSGILLQDGYSEELGYGGPQWSYPVAHEHDGKLYVIYTAQVEERNIRGAVVSVVPME